MKILNVIILLLSIEAAETLKHNAPRVVVCQVFFFYNQVFLV